MRSFFDLEILSVRLVVCLLLVLCLGLSSHAHSADSKKQLKLSPDSQAERSPVAIVKNKTPQIAVYKSMKKDGTASFSDRQPLNRPYQVMRYDCFACDPASDVNWYTTPLYTRPYNQLIAKAAQEHELDPALIRAVIHAESSFRPAVISRKGAIGLMQLMPETAQQLGVTDASKPAENIAAGSRYLAKLLKQHNGEVALALAAYNAGASNVKKYNGIPPFAETKAYIERVAILHKRYQQQG